MEIRTGRLSRSVGFVLSVLLLWAGQGVAAEKVFKLGVVGAFTGPSSQNGAEFKASVEMALGKINYKIGDYKIEPVWIDEQNDPAKASSAYAEAVERSGIQAGILDWTTTASMPIMDLAAQYKVPHMFTEGASSIINDKYNSDKAKYSYFGGKFWPVPSKLVVGYVDCLNDAIKRGLWKPQSKLVAIYGEDTDWGRNAGVAYRAAFEKAGWKVVSEDYAPTTQTDFYPLLSKYKKAGVSVLAGTANAPPFMSAFIKQTAEVGLKAAIIQQGGPRLVERGEGEVRLYAEPIGRGLRLRRHELLHQDRQARDPEAQGPGQGQRLQGADAGGQHRETDLYEGGRRHRDGRVQVHARVDSGRRGGAKILLLPCHPVHERSGEDRSPCQHEAAGLQGAAVMFEGERRALPGRLSPSLLR